MSLSLTNVSYGFGGISVLNGINLNTEVGEWLAVLGANGSGRSTLAEIMAGLRRPQGGKVFYAGMDIWHRSGRTARGQLGLVMQRAENQFLGDTVFDDVAFGPRQKTNNVEEIARAVRRGLELTDFDVDELKDRSPLEFSGGQRRRLAVAGILALKPSVLILDEPFAGLDCQARQDMVQLLLKLRERSGMTIVTLTSDLELISESTRMVLLMDGQIALAGNLRDFIANQLLCREAGIVMPETIHLALELRERGWNVPVVGPEGALEAAIAGEWRQRSQAKHA